MPCECKESDKKVFFEFGNWKQSCPSCGECEIVKVLPKRAGIENIDIPVLTKAEKKEIYDECYNYIIEKYFKQKKFQDMKIHRAAFDSMANLVEILMEEGLNKVKGLDLNGE